MPMPETKITQVEETPTKKSISPESLQISEKYPTLEVGQQIK